MPVAVIDAANADSVLPGLAVPENVRADVAHAASQGLVVAIPEQPILLGDWSGVGYLKQDPQTGESGWMLTGGIAGGMTAWGPDSWPELFHKLFQDPLSERSQVNDDPAAATYIRKVEPTDWQKGTVGQPLAEPLRVMVYDSAMRPVEGAKVVFTVREGGGELLGDAGASGYSVSCFTDHRGQAKAVLTLGRYTADNPDFWFETGYTYIQQVGANVVQAALASGALTDAPFMAYGFPDVEDPALWQMAKTHGDGKEGPIFAWAGFVNVVVADAFGNPISNQEVAFTRGRVSELSPCVEPVENPAPLLLIHPQDPCVEDGIPYYGQCGQGSVISVTGWGGAMCQIMAGGTPDAQYTIDATCQGLARSFTLTTWDFGNCDGESRPDAELFLGFRTEKDTQGRSIDAALVGKTLPVNVQCLALKEGKELDPDLGWLGDRNFRLEPAEDVLVKINGLVAQDQGQDWYRVENVPVGDVPGPVPVAIQAWATVDERELYGSMVHTVHAVEIQTPPEVVIYTDKQGFALADFPVEYTVHTADYRAASAILTIYKDGVPFSVVPTAAQGSPCQYTLAKGTWFDLEKSYQAQVTLNPGGIMQMESERVELKITPLIIDLDIDSDNNDNTDFPERIDYEDAVEDLVTKEYPGKLIMVNDKYVDTNENGVPDFADGINIFGNESDGACEKFIPMVLEIPEPVDLSVAMIKVEYSQSDPSQITRNEGSSPDSYIYYPAPKGHIRIWLKDGPDSRRKEDVASGNGDFITSGNIYNASNIGVDASRQTVLYVEAVKTGTKKSDYTISILLDPDGSNTDYDYIVQDRVRVRPFAMHIVKKIPDTDEYLVLNGKGVPIYAPHGGGDKTRYRYPDKWSMMHINVPENFDDSIEDEIWFYYMSDDCSFDGLLAETSANSMIYSYTEGEQSLLLSIDSVSGLEPESIDSLEVTITIDGIDGLDIESCLGLQNDHYSLLETDVDSNEFTPIRYFARVAFEEEPNYRIINHMHVDLERTHDDRTISMDLTESSDDSGIFVSDDGDMILHVINIESIPTGAVDYIVIEVNNSIFQEDEIELTLQETGYQTNIFTNMPISIGASSYEYDPVTENCTVNVMIEEGLGDIEFNVELLSNCDVLSISTKELNDGVHISSDIAIVPLSDSIDYPGCRELFTDLNLKGTFIVAKLDDIDQTISTPDEKPIFVGIGVPSEKDKRWYSISDRLHSVFFEKGGSIDWQKHAEDVIKAMSGFYYNSQNDGLQYTLLYRDVIQPDMHVTDVDLIERIKYNNFSMFYIVAHGGGGVMETYQSLSVFNESEKYELTTVGANVLKKVIHGQNASFDLVFLNACHGFSGSFEGASYEWKNVFNADILIGWGKIYNNTEGSTVWVSVDCVGIKFWKYLSDGLSVEDSLDNCFRDCEHTSDFMINLTCDGNCYKKFK